MADGFIDCEYCGEQMAAWRHACPECGFDRRTGKVDRPLSEVLDQLVGKPPDPQKRREVPAAHEEKGRENVRRSEAFIRRVERPSGCAVAFWIAGAVLAAVGIVAFPLPTIALCAVVVVVWLLFFRRG